MPTLDDFHTWSHHLYQLSRHPDCLSLYLSDTSNLAAQELNAEKEKFNDKRYLPSLLTEGVLPILGVFENGEYTGDSLERIPVVLKPAKGTQGDHVRFFPHGLADPDRDVWAVSTAMSGAPIIATPYLEQHKYAKDIWGNSANTLRIQTYHHHGEPRVACAVHKWGSVASGFTDNFSKAGYTTLIRNGILGDTIEDFSPMDSRPPSCTPVQPAYDTRVPFSVHPDSYMPIRGTVLPFWEETLRLVLSAADLLHGRIEWAGWDVMITTTGPKIIEVNPEPGIQLLQVHTPLLGDVDVKAFMIENEVPGVEWTH